MSEIARLLPVLVLLALTAAAVYPVFARARTQARASSRARFGGRLIFMSLIVLAGAAAGRPRV